MVRVLELIDRYQQRRAQRERRLRGFLDGEPTTILHTVDLTDIQSTGKCIEKPRQVLPGCKTEC